MASDLTDIARTTQTQVLSAMGAVQDTMIESYTKMASTVTKLVPARITSLVPEMPYLPKPAEAMDLSFGFAEKVLASQKSFVEKLLVAADKAPTSAATPVKK